MASEKNNDFISYMKGINEERNKENQQLSDLLKKAAGKGKENKQVKEPDKPQNNTENSDSELEEAYRNTAEHIRIGNYSE